LPIENRSDDAPPAATHFSIFVRVNGGKDVGPKEETGLKRGTGTKAGVASSGYQEAMIVVKGGNSPDIIVVEHGKPVRLSFRREETASCSEMVVMEDFGKSATLPEGQVVSVEFVPEKPGEYEFHCHMAGSSRYPRRLPGFAGRAPAPTSVPRQGFILPSDMDSRKSLDCCDPVVPRCSELQ